MKSHERRCLAPKALKTFFVDASVHPSFVTKSVRLNRTELSIGGICSKSRDITFRRVPGFS